MAQFTTVEEPKRGPVDFLLCAGNPLIVDRFLQGRTFVVNLMTTQTRNGRLIGKRGVAQLPGASSVERSNEVAHGSLEMHTMTTKTIVH